MKATNHISVGVLCIFSYLSAAYGKPYDVVGGGAYPLGCNLESVSFSWKLPPNRSGMEQTAYRIVVAGAKEDLGKNPLWDSGKVVSSQSVKVPYGGKTLKSRQKCHFKVRYWDENGEASPWSDIKTFELGLLKNSDWLGEWIGADEPVEKRTAVRNLGKKKHKVILGGDKPAYLRKEFSLGKNILKARAYIATLGIFQLYFNGKKAGNDFWGTGWTDYDTRVQSNTYDITHLLRSGNNTVGVLLGGGWYSGRVGWDMNACPYGDTPMTLVQIEVEYADGGRALFKSDASWKWSRGPIVAADIFDGEDYDARLEQKGWNGTAFSPSLKNLYGLFGSSEKFDDTKWRRVKTKKLENILVEPRRSPPVVLKKTLTPVSVKKVKSGVFIFDMGQNTVGWAKVKIPAVPNRKITIRFAEVLDKDGSLYTENYRTARSTDTYICAKNGTETYEPVLTFHGFRYVELSGLPEDAAPKLDWVEGKIVYSDLREIGSFKCSEEKINRLQSNIQWGQRCNFFSIPTDCPQRDERLGWLGDAQAFVATAAFNMDVDAFYNKWLLDVRDAARDGVYPDIAPCQKASWFANNKGNPVWGDAGVICPWEIYLAYGDIKILRDNYPTVKKWLQYIAKRADGGLRPKGVHGDWLQPYAKNYRDTDSSKELISQAYYVRVADLAHKMAKILGHEADAKHFDETAASARNVFCKHFLKENGVVENDCQTSYLLALAFDILPESARPAAFKNLIRAIERTGNHLRTGFVGTPLLNPVLTRFGRSDVAYKLLFNETYPSWLYSINKGATTMWEHWNGISEKGEFEDPKMNSFNHYAYGAIGKWLYKDVAGLWHDENAAGYKNIMFAPNPSKKMSFASASNETPYGRASSSWCRKNGVLEWSVVIPPNATGTLVFPTANFDSIKINGRHLPKGTPRRTDGRPVLSGAKSGNYRILMGE